MTLAQTSLDRLLSVAGWLALAGLWAFALYHVSYAPEIVPTHFDGSGAPDDYGSRWSLLILPGIATFVFIAFTILSRFPHIFNYAVKITPANAAHQYRLATRFMHVEKLAIMLVIAMVIRLTVRSAESASAPPETRMLFVVLGLLLVPTFVYLFLSLRDKQPED